MSLCLQKQSRPFLKKKDLKKSLCAARPAEKLESRQNGGKEEVEKARQFGGPAFVAFRGYARSAWVSRNILSKDPSLWQALPRVCIARLFR